MINGGYNGRSLVQWLTRPLHNGPQEVPCAAINQRLLQNK